MKHFRDGVMVGLGIALVLVLGILVFRFFQERDRKIYEYMERKHEIELLQEAINNRPADDFLDDAGVRGAADGASAEFRRKRDEAVQRIRSRRAD